MASNLAPIILFTYNRPDHTLKTLAALSHNLYAHESELFVFCDGAKHPDDEELVQSVRDVVRSKQWCGKVHIVEQASNRGLANSIIDGVTEMCKEFGKVIVLEDDLVTSPYFLEYMNHALDLYAEASEVMQISGHMFPVDLKTETDAIFLSFTTSWGWATWERAWKSFDPDATSYSDLENNKHLQYQFNLNGSYPYFNMLKDQLNGKINSWAIRWYLSVFMAEGLTLHPKKSLVSNIGFDGSGTHCGKDDVDNFVYNQSITSFPTKNKIDNLFFESITSYLKLSSNSKRMKSRISRLLARLRQKISVLIQAVN
jgi:hypothetical protein